MTHPQYLPEQELLAEMLKNEKEIREAQARINQLTRRNMALQAECNTRRNNKAFNGYPIGHIFCFVGRSTR